jgi:hypothetical protein
MGEYIGLKLANLIITTPVNIVSDVVLFPWKLWKTPRKLLNNERVPIIPVVGAVLLKGCAFLDNHCLDQYRGSVFTTENLFYHVKIEETFFNKENIKKSDIADIVDDEIFTIANYINDKEKKIKMYGNYDNYRADRMKYESISIRKNNNKLSM